MKKMSKLALTMSVLLGLAVCAQDADARGRVNHRQIKQQARINQGIGNGELTRREAFRVQRNQAKLARQEQRMRASGDGLTAKERVKLERQQDQLSKQIYNQKHDGQDRN